MKGKNHGESYEKYNFQGFLMQDLSNFLSFLRGQMARAREGKPSAYSAAAGNISVLKSYIVSWFNKYSKEEMALIELNLKISEKQYDLNNIEEAFYFLDQAYILCLKILKKDGAVFPKLRQGSITFKKFIEQETGN